MIDQKLSNLEVVNFIELLKQTDPIEIIRYDLSEIKVGKQQYFISIFIIVFGSIIIFSNRKALFSNKTFKKIKKSII